MFFWLKPCSVHRSTPDATT